MLMMTFQEAYARKQDVVEDADVGKKASMQSKLHPPIVYRCSGFSLQRRKMWIFPHMLDARVSEKLEESQQKQSVKVEQRLLNQPTVLKYRR